jgi:hypothetical protein
MVGMERGIGEHMGWEQRVFNDLYPAFSPQNDLAPHKPIPPSPVSKLDRRHTGRLRKRGNLLRGGGVGEWSQIIRQRESRVLYKSFNTLWVGRIEGGNSGVQLGDNSRRQCGIKKL